MSRRVTWIGPIPRTKRGPKRGGGVMRSDNLRPAPSLFTPAFVKQMLDLMEQAPSAPEPVKPVRTPRVKPTLRIVQTPVLSPAEHARRTDECEAALVPAASPPRSKRSNTPAPCEVETPAARQAAVPAPSREPAPPRPDPVTARAHTHAPPGRFAAYAESIASARSFLTGKSFTVRRHDPDAMIARWAVSGHFGLLSNEELIDLAIRNGMAGDARG